MHGLETGRYGSAPSARGTTGSRLIPLDRVRGALVSYRVLQVERPGALSIKLYVVLARYLWSGRQRVNNGPSNHKHIASSTKNVLLRGPVLVRGHLKGCSTVAFSCRTQSPKNERQDKIFNHCLTQETFGKLDQKNILDASLAFSNTDFIRKHSNSIY